MRDFERLVLEELLARDEPRGEVLRQQCAAATVSQREFSGVGFFTSFQLPESVAKLPDAASFPLAVDAELDGVEDGAGFILFIRGGVIDFLEGYVNTGAWPDEPFIKRFL